MNDQFIRKVPGVGLMNEKILNGLGIHTCKQIIEKSVEIYVNFTPNAFQFLISCALGISRVVHEAAV
jgi:DNA polymerase kappa